MVFSVTFYDWASDMQFVTAGMCIDTVYGMH